MKISVKRSSDIKTSFIDHLAPLAHRDQMIYHQIKSKGRSERSASNPFIPLMNTAGVNCNL